MIYAIPVVGTLLLGVWLYLRRDYRFFKKIYPRVKVPRVCWITFGKKLDWDYVYWGKTRHRFIRKDGKRDLRYSMNFRVCYPTKIGCRGFTIWIWNIEKARAFYREVSIYMVIKIDDILFKGEIVGDIYKFFNYNIVEYVRWCAKLFSWCGYQVVMSDPNTNIDAIMQYKNKLYYLHCFFQREPVVRGELEKLPEIPKGATWVLPATPGFSKQARKLTVEKNWLCMDEDCLRTSLKYEYPQFM